MYEGSVKRIFSSNVSANLIFEFTDDYSVFDWGKMPDAIPFKGLGLAKLMSVLFERLESCGVKTHYRGFDGERCVLVEKIEVTRPVRIIEKGRSYYAYPKTMEKPFLIPLEVVFRFEVCAGSSFIKRHAEKNYQIGDVFQVPFIEMFTKLEDKDRPLSDKEALKISGLTQVQFNEVISKTTEVSLLLKSWFSEKNIRLLDGKLEWGLSKENEIILVDAIGPDEMRLEKQGLQLSKELLREFYRKTPWYRELENAKAEGEVSGYTDWKTLVKPPPPLPASLKCLVSEIYQSLVNEIVEERVFPCSDLDHVIKDMIVYIDGVS